MRFEIFKKRAGVRSATNSVRRFRYHPGNPQVDWLLSLVFAGSMIAIGLYLTTYAEGLIVNDATIEDLQRAAYETPKILDLKSARALLGVYEAREEELARVIVSPVTLFDPSL